MSVSMSKICLKYAPNSLKPCIYAIFLFQKYFQIRFAPRVREPQILMNKAFGVLLFSLHFGSRKNVIFFIGPNVASMSRFISCKEGSNRMTMSLPSIHKTQGPFLCAPKRHGYTKFVLMPFFSK